MSTPPARRAVTTRLPVDLKQRLVAETLGTCFLLIAVVGSGIMASRLSSNDIGLQLLENSLATAGALVGVIFMFGNVSGAHLNPIVSLVQRLCGEMSSAVAALYAAAQILGACVGTVLANLMFDLDAVSISTQGRASSGLWLAEVIASLGLLLVIHAPGRSGRTAVAPFAIGAWIGGAYWFTSSTSFANPAVTIARTLSNTFAGIDPTSVPPFLAMQLVGALLAFWIIRLIYPQSEMETSSV